MSIANEIQRLQTAKSNLKTQLEAKGVSVSSNATLDAYPNYVSEITPMVYSGDVQSIIDGFAGGTLSGSINISSGNTSQLRDYLFAGMSNITGVTYYVVGNKSIPNDCFNNCTNLTSVNIVGPGRITSVGIEAFRGCRNLRTLPFLEDLTNIAGNAFQDCPLTGITFNSGLTAIGTMAFAYSDNIKGAFSGQGITIPSNITMLEGNYSTGTFQNTSATAFTFMGNVIRLGSNYSNSNYCYFRGNSQCEEYDFTHNFIVPQRVPSNEFEGSKEGYRIVVPQALYDNWITTQNWTAFTSHIVSAQNIYDVTDYEYSYNGSSIPSISNNGDYYVLSNTGSDGEGRVEIYGKNNKSLFRTQYYITDIAISSGVTEISDEFCYNCARLTAVTIPNSVTTIGTYAFYTCTGLTSVTIPNSVTTISNGAFNFCTGLTSVTIPNSVTTIGDHAFWGCPFINSGYTFPDGIVTIENSAFGRDGDTVNIVDGAVFNIPDSVTTIGNEFLYHQNETGTTYINIGSGITSIGNNFFQLRGSSWSHKLYLTIKAVVPPTLGSNPHLNGAAGGAIYVPAESVDAYKAANGWSNYANYIYPIPEE